MAVLEKLRNRAGFILIIFVGLGLLLFVIDPSQLNFTGQNNVAGEVDGQKIYFDEYNQMVNQRVDATMAGSSAQARDQVSNQIWNEIIQQQLLADEYKKLGINVTEAELEELTTGSNPHPMIQRYFTNPNTGQFDRTLLTQYISNIDNPQLGDFKRLWYTYLLPQVEKDQKYDEYLTLISKGILMTDLEVKKKQAELERKVSFNYVVERYSSIRDSAVTVTDSDLKDYYKEHKQEFEQDESRDIKYVVFPIVPSREDDARIKQTVEELKPRFVSGDSATIQRTLLLSAESFDPTYVKASELSSAIRDSIVEADSGKVVGPYFENDAYKLSKLMDVKTFADSAKARHILISTENRQPDSAYAKIDSIKTAIEEGADFAAMARELSEDPGSKEDGGMYDFWITETTQFVEPFKQACYRLDVGEMEIVQTNYGFHLIEVVERKALHPRYQVANLVKNVIPSSETRNSIYKQASQFANENKTIEQLEEAANTNPELLLKDGKKLTKSAYIPEISDPKPILGWAYSSKVGDVSGVLRIASEMYIVAALTAVHEKGYAPPEDVEEQIRAEVIKAKKAEQLVSKIKEKLAGTSDIESLASKLNSPVEEANNVTFASASINIGFEPEVVAKAFNMPVNTLSEPVKGEHGVFVVSTTNISEVPEVDDIERLRARFKSGYLGNRSWMAFQAMKEAAEIEDNRLSPYYIK